MKKPLISTIFLFIASLGYSQYIHDLFPCRDSSGARVEGCFAWSDSQGQYIQVTDTSFCLTDTLIVQYRTVNNAWGYDQNEVVYIDTLLGQCGQILDTTSISDRIDVNEQAIIDTASQIRNDFPIDTQVDTTSLSDRIDINSQAIIDTATQIRGDFPIDTQVDTTSLSNRIDINSQSIIDTASQIRGDIPDTTSLSNRIDGLDLQSVTDNGATTTNNITVGGLDITTVATDSDNSATGILVHDDITSEVEKKAIGENEIVFGTANGGVESDASITITDSTINIAPDTYIKIDNDREIYAVGYRAGYSNTTGIRWLAQGYQAGNNNTTGSFWMAQGFQAGYSNTTGSFWIAQGYRAGSSNTTGSDWLAQGYFAGYNNTTGSRWIAQGYFAGYNNTTGSRWIAQGYFAGYNNTTGSRWIAQGYFAGYNNTTGSRWIAQGYFAGYNNTTGSRWIAQGYFAGYNNTTGSNWLAQGYQAGNNNTTGSFWMAQGFRAGYNANGSDYVITGSQAGTYVTGSNPLDSINNSVLIGSGTKSGADTVINVTVIGYDAEGHGSNTATVGNTSTNEFHSGNVGFDVSTTPSEGDIYKYDSGSGLFELVQPASDSIHGWAEYSDTIYTTSNRLSIAPGDTVTLANNAGETITSHLPLGVTSLYNATDTLITPDRSGDSYNIRVDFTASSSSNDGYFSLVLDIGGSQGIILSNLKTFPKGSGIEHDFSTTSAIYTLDTFIANGGKLKIIGGVGTTEIWDINLVIIRTSRARN